MLRSFRYAYLVDVGGYVMYACVQCVHALLFVCLSVGLSVYLSVRPSVCRSVCMHACMHASLYYVSRTYMHRYICVCKYVCICIHRDKHKCHINVCLVLCLVFVFVILGSLVVVSAKRGLCKRRRRWASHPQVLCGGYSQWVRFKAAHGKNPMISGLGSGFRV